MASRPASLPYLSWSQRLATVGAGLAEVIWPTRCIVCDEPGAVLCAECALHLPFIDLWNACPICGAPYGRYQCTECNTFRLHQIGVRTLPYAQCVSAVEFSDDVARIVRGRKDGHELRLDSVLAYYIACAIPPKWLTNTPVVCSVPASARALRIRGFDHGWRLAQNTAGILHLPSQQLLSGSPRHDQRGLHRSERFTNMHAAFTLNCPPPSCALVIDDVFTTGATLIAAAQALRDGGVKRVYAATFAHVYQ